MCINISFQQVPINVRLQQCSGSTAVTCAQIRQQPIQYSHLSIGQYRRRGYHQCPHRANTLEKTFHFHRQDRKEDFSGYCWVSSCLSLKRIRQQLRRAQDERRGTQEEDRADLEEASSCRVAQSQEGYLGRFSAYDEELAHSTFSLQ